MGEHCHNWEIWLADIPFEDNSGSKVRPVIILNRTTGRLNVLPLTTHEPRLGDYDLPHWAEAGLPKPSAVRIPKLSYIATSAVIKKIGDVHSEDKIEILQLLL
jgi:hypothetical protein